MPAFVRGPFVFLKDLDLVAVTRSLEACWQRKVRGFIGLAETSAMLGNESSDLYESFAAFQGGLVISYLSDCCVLMSSCFL